MKAIPAKLKKEMAADPYYKTCARQNEDCDGRITWEHAVIFGGNQIQAKWAIIPICEFHHAVNKHQDGGDLNKEINMHIALNRASDSELLSISKAINYLELRIRLNKKYGERRSDIPALRY